MQNENKEVKSVQEAFDAGKENKEKKRPQGRAPVSVDKIRGNYEAAPDQVYNHPDYAPWLVRDGAGQPHNPEEPMPVMDRESGKAMRPIAPNTGATIDQVVAEMPVAKAIGVEQVRKAKQILENYKKGKKMLEEKIVRNEKWWRMRHWDLLKNEANYQDPKPASGWLFNCIISKHADFMDSFPGINILPREETDREEAKRLSSIIPVIMEQNDYEQVYSDEIWYKLKNGTGVYGVFWDPSKLNGLGDISIRSMDLLQLFWEPGVTDIQKSQNFFSVELIDNDILEAKYPECRGKLKKVSDNTVKKYWYDENIDTTGKSAVIDWYYHKTVNGKRTLQYCKFVDEIVLYATENDTEVPTVTQAAPVTDEKGNPVKAPDGTPYVAMEEVPTGPSVAEKGWYDHGLYPFVFDVLFKEEGMPVGFGFVDVCKNAQMSIDLLNNAFEKNALLTCTPRYFYRQDGTINEKDFLDYNKAFVKVEGNLGEDSIRPIEVPNLINGNYMAMLDGKIAELKETAGNRDTSNGGTLSGVTAASAIAAMQESAGKTSRDQIKTTYRAHEQVVSMVIELIRQFYEMPRQFRIMGPRGEEEYVMYSNAGIRPEDQGTEFGVDMGFRLPVFDIKVTAEKESVYSQLSQNELALQFYNNGFFNPQYADQALAAVDMMEFQNKEMITQKIQQNGGMYQQILMMQQQMMQMSEMIDSLTGGQTQLAESTAMGVEGQLNAAEMQNNTSGAVTQAAKNAQEESAVTRNARAQAAATTRPR